MEYKQLLQSHHLKATQQRIEIIECIQNAGHISIDDLYQNIRQKFTSISLATLYKNIHTMLRTNLIREVKILGQKTKYEIEKEPHIHILCKTCGELKDIPFDSFSVIQEMVKKEDYMADDVLVVVSGICPLCRKKV